MAESFDREMRKLTHNNLELAIKLYYETFASALDKDEIELFLNVVISNMDNLRESFSFWKNKKRE